MFWLYNIFLWLKPAECTEYQENKQDIERFWIALKVVFISMQITYLLHTFHRTEISWLFLGTTFRFASFHFTLYIILVKAEFFQVRNFKEMCLQPRWYTSVSLQLHVYANKLPFIQQISLETRMWPLISQMLPFLGSLFFWLSRFFKLCFRLFFPTF